MFKNDLTTWAVNFFTSTKVKSDGVFSKKPAHEYDIKDAMVALQWILQDAGASRIPPGCKLVHQHYRNPDIHTNLDNRLYIVLDKRVKGEYYVEYYLREESTGYRVGYEAIKGDGEATPANRHSTENSLFEVPVDSMLYKSASLHLSHNQIKESRADYERSNAAFEELMKDFLP